MKKIYISNSAKDFAFNSKLGTFLYGCGFRTVDRIMTRDDSFKDSVEEKLREVDIAIIVVSQSTLLSEWSKIEIEQAIKLNKKIILVVIDSSQLPESLKKLQYINCKDDNEDGFAQLRATLLNLTDKETKSADIIPEITKMGTDYREDNPKEEIEFKYGIGGMGTDDAGAPIEFDNAEQLPNQTNTQQGTVTNEATVYLSCAAPNVIQIKEEFTARFAAYIDEFRNEIENKLKKLSPDATIVLDYKECQWKTGTKIKVRVSGNNLMIENPEETFIWNGRSVILDFDITAPEVIPDLKTILKFDVFIDEITVARMRMDIEISNEKTDKKTNTVAGRAIKTAFASYASEDRDRVLDRVSEIVRNGVDVFMDCMSLHPGDEWKPKLETEIKNRESFLLFWSKSAGGSPWVTWEWKTALAKRGGIDGIEPHPLEDPKNAPPPDELKELHFNDVYNLVRN